MKLRKAKPKLLRRYKTGTVNVELLWPDDTARIFSVPLEGKAMQLVRVPRSHNHSWRRLNDYSQTLELRDIVSKL